MLHCQPTDRHLGAAIVIDVLCNEDLIARVSSVSCIYLVHLVRQVWRLTQTGCASLAKLDADSVTVNISCPGPACN